MARKIGTEYDITAELQEITIPVGDEGVGQTLINDGAAEIFWRERDVTLSETDIEAASAAVLVATPLFFSRLGPGEFTHQAGIVIYAIRDTTTQTDSVLRVAPGRLYQSGDVDLAGLATSIGNTTDVPLAGETPEGATARTGISLWKRAVNKLIDIKAAIGMGGTADTTTPEFVEQINATIRVNGTSVNGVALAGATPYLRATVTARKKVTDIDNASTANVGTIWIGRSAADISGATPLTSGQSMNLFDNGDLADYFLIVESANDGVSIAYSAAG